MENFIIYTILVTSILQITSLPIQNGCSPPKVQDYKKNVSIEVPSPFVFSSVDPILKILQSSQYNTHEGAQQIVNLYQLAKERKKEFEKSGGKKNYPLIVLEGLAGTGKSTLVKGLTKKINGVQSHSPSPTVQKVRALFLNDTVMDNTYHHFSHYVTALEVNILLKDSPVVLDRFWHSSATYAIAREAYSTQGAYSLPPKGDKIYNWPEDLLKPDVVLYLDVDENIRMQRLYHRLENNTEIKTSGKTEVKLGKNELLLQACPEYRNNVILAYKSMDKPAVIFLNASLSIEDVLNEAYSKVEPLLKPRS